MLLDNEFKQIAVFWSSPVETNWEICSYIPQDEVPVYVPRAARVCPKHADGLDSFNCRLVAQLDILYTGFMNANISELASLTPIGKHIIGSRAMERSH